MKITNFITLPDGRKLCYAEFGRPDGYPVIHFQVISQFDAIVQALRN
jgi:hypothetical protein